MLILLLALAAPQDTVRLPAGDMLSRAETVSGAVQAATARTGAAEATAVLLGRPANPVVSVVAENLGAQRQVTGRSGLEGTEGQAVLALPLALGGDLAARRREGTARVAVAQGEVLRTTADVREATLLAIATWQRERALLEASRAERDALATLAGALAARVAEGRDPAASASLARVEATAARSRYARQLAAAAEANAALAALLGLAPGTPVDVAPLACAAPAARRDSTGSADLATLDARIAAAEAAVAVARAGRIPDLVPEVGYRRSAGFSGLLVGLSVELPLLNGRGPGVAAALAERDATAGDRAELARAIDGEIAGHRRALALLAAEAPRYDQRWRDDLDAAVAAEAARLELGEGSLYRLFDARRARLQALTEYQAWRESARRHQVRLARLGLGPLDAAQLCLPEDVR